MRIAVLAGGRTPERDVSLRSGYRTAAALAELGHEAWLVDPSELPLVETLLEHRPNLAWLALHGKEGEDGTVQRLLHLLGIPHTGTAAFDCRIASDKVLAKAALHRAGVPTPPWAVIEGAALRDLGAGAALPHAISRVGLPCVVKPARSGSALGVSFVEREADLASAVLAALSYSDAAIVERKVDGTEVAASLLGDPLIPLPLVEIAPKSGVYDYAARYTAGATEFVTPAPLDDVVASAVQDAATRAASTLGLRDLTRVDIIIDRAGDPWVLEVNVSPGMTETSLLPMAGQTAGMSLASMCDAILRSHRQRHTRSDP